MFSRKPAQATQVQAKPRKANKGPCPWLCNLVPTNVPCPGRAQTVLHPRKDVFVLKVAKVGANGDRRCKMELELVTPKGPEKKPPVEWTPEKLSASLNRVRAAAIGVRGKRRENRRVSTTSPKYHR